MADINSIAKQFTEFYYATFDRNRAELAPLYRETSMLTFEGDPISGAVLIVKKLVSLPFASVAHTVITMDAQPSSSTGTILVSVTGTLLVDNGSNPLQFSQVFNLVPEGGSYYVLNDVFRLNYT